MKYIALIYSNEKTDPKPGSDEFIKMIGEYRSATDKFIEDGVYDFSSIIYLNCMIKWLI